MKKTIAVDIDDVLAANAEGFVQFSNMRWGTNLTVQDYDEHWSEVWGVGHDETNQRAIEMEQNGVLKTLNHFTDALPILRELSTQFRLIIITSRRQHMKQDTEDWINTYFPGVFEETFYSGFWEEVSDAANERTKAELCRELGANYLIDDQLKHCLAAAELGVEALLFGAYSWNQTDQYRGNMTRVSDWAAVAEYFRAES